MVVMAKMTVDYVNANRNFEILMKFKKVPRYPLFISFFYLPFAYYFTVDTSNNQSLIENTNL